MEADSRRVASLLKGYNKMLIKEDEVSKRLNNPLNLINQMKAGLRNNKKNEAMSLFIPPTKQALNPFNNLVVTEKAGDRESFNDSSMPADEANSENLIPDSDAKIKLALAHDRALEVMTNAINMAGVKLDDIKPAQLPGVIVAMSKVVGNIRAERAERDKANKGNDVHLHFYCPEQRKIEQYQVIDVAY
jgi:hypothetical protein